MHWQPTEQPGGLRGPLTSYLGDSAKGLFQHVETVEMDVASQHVWQGVADRRAVLHGREVQTSVV